MTVLVCRSPFMTVDMQFRKTSILISREFRASENPNAVSTRVFIAVAGGR